MEDTMTMQEAFNDLYDYYANGCYNGDNGICMLTIENALEAMKKQIPMKPIIDVLDNDMPDILWKCPRCGEIHNKVDEGCPNYCHECGQAIDWD